MAGAQFGEMDRWLAPLKDREPNAENWGKAWSDMAQQQEDEAALDLKEGYRRSAGARYLRAAVYRQYVIALAKMSGVRILNVGPKSGRSSAGASVRR
jgi:hypothetical protein